jgi:hypothetical protein
MLLISVESPVVCITKRKEESISGSFGVSTKGTIAVLPPYMVESLHIDSFPKLSLCMELN